MDKIGKNIGQVIRDARNGRGLSQAELAEMVGVSQAAIGQWERGTFTPRGRNLKILSEVLDVPLRPMLLPPALEDAVAANLNREDKDIPSPGRSEFDTPPQRQEELLIAEESQTRLIVAEHKAQAGEFERAFLLFLSEADPTVQCHTTLFFGRGSNNRWTVDYLTHREVIEIAHPSSYSRAEELITRTLWRLTVLRSLIRDRKSYVAIVRRPPLAPLSAHALPFYESKFMKLMAEANLVGIHLLIVDTPEEAIEALDEIDGDRPDEVTLA